jgi:hypothetical protein
MAGLTSLLVGFGGTVAQGMGQRSQARYEADVASTNARLAQFRAEDAVRRGDVEASRSLAATRQVVGSQRAQMAAQGLDVASGTPLDLQQETAGTGAIDAQTIRNNAWREAFGYRVEALDQKTKAKMSRLSGRQALRSSILTGGARFFADAGAMYPKQKKSGDTEPSWANV